MRQNVIWGLINGKSDSNSPAGEQDSRLPRCFRLSCRFVRGPPVPSSRALPTQRIYALVIQAPILLNSRPRLELLWRVATSAEPTLLLIAIRGRTCLVIKRFSFHVFLPLSPQTKKKGLTRRGRPLAKLCRWLQPLRFDKSVALEGSPGTRLTSLCQEKASRGEPFHHVIVVRSYPGENTGDLHNLYVGPLLVA